MLYRTHVFSKLGHIIFNESRLPGNVTSTKVTQLLAYPGYGLECNSLPYEWLEDGSKGTRAYDWKTQELQYWDKIRDSDELDSFRREMRISQLNTYPDSEEFQSIDEKFYRTKLVTLLKAKTNSL